MSNPLRTLLALALVLPAACEKEGENSGKASGALDDSERALLVHLPAGATAVFGGNYKTFLDNWETSPLKRLTDANPMLSGPTGMRDYMDCWMQDATRDVVVAGSLEVKSGFTLNMVFGGLSADMLERCSKKGGFSINADPDGKFIRVDGIPDGVGGKTSAGYYFVDPNTAFFTMDMKVSALAPAASTPGRAEIEARLARARQAPAIDDPVIKKMIEQADRSKAFWISGNAANTPLAGKVGAGHAWLDASKDAVTIGFSVELDSAGTASDVVSKFNDAKKEIGQAPPQLAEAAEEIFKAVKLSARGKVLSGQIRITNAAVDKVMPLMKAFGGRGF